MTGPNAEIAAAPDAEMTVSLLLVAVFWVAFFCWLTVIGWAIQRRKEREAYYRHETERRLVDKAEATAEEVVRLRNEEERARWLRRREGLKLGGLITGALGVGIVVSLRFIDTDRLAVSPIGWIPLVVGAVVLLYAYVLCPRFADPRENIPLLPSDERGDSKQD